jgi:hypothetical protein
MPSLGDILENSQGGQAISTISHELGLTPEQTQDAVTALLPAISLGLKRSTTTPEGLANLFRAMGAQQHLGAMFDDPKMAFSQAGQAAGNDLLGVLFGSPDVSRAVADQAQQFSGIGSSILRKLLPIIVGMLISGMMKSGQAAPSPQPKPQATPPSPGGSLRDIIGQIFGRGAGASPAGSAIPPQQTSAPGGQSAPLPTNQSPLPLPGGQQQPLPIPGDQPFPAPGNPGGQSLPGGSILDQILREIQKGIQDGRIKPVVIPLPLPGQTPDGGTMPSGSQHTGDILGQILRDILAGTQRAGPGMPRGQPQALMMASDTGAGARVFGDQFEIGRDVDPRYIENLVSAFDRFQSA